MVLEPTALVVGDVVVVLAFAGEAPTLLDTVSLADADALTAAVREALSISADVLHRGWRHLPPSWLSRIDAVTHRLRGLALEQAARALLDLLAAVQSGVPGREALERWATTHLRLLVTAEQL